MLKYKIQNNYLMPDLYKPLILEVKNCVDNLSSPSDWSDALHVQAAIEDLSNSYDEDYKVASSDIDYIFNQEQTSSHQTEQTIQLLDIWDSRDSNPTMVALVSAIMTNFGFKESDSSLIKPVLMSAILAEVPSDLEYHSNLHFKKVVLHISRMIQAHNHIFSNTRNIFAKDKIALMLCAACIHDLGHDGKGNVIDRKYHMAKTEKRSFDLALPYLKSAGLSEEDMEKMNIMLIGTDVSPFGDPISPASQLRRAYEFHFGGAEEDEPLDLSDELAVLEDDSALCQMAVMLHEADIMNSAAVNYEITKKESIAISKETGSADALPEDTLVFLEKICCNELLSDSARFLGSDNLNTIIENVVKDYKEGNKSYF